MNHPLVHGMHAFEAERNDAAGKSAVHMDAAGEWPNVSNIDNVMCTEK